MMRHAGWRVGAVASDPFIDDEIAKALAPLLVDADARG
jgi:hypothetical protein